jgi:Protein of unknown function (DUF3298)/HNH endonuclease
LTTRDAVPAEIRRAVLCEAGHRCAIRTCKHPAVEIHHIVPWETCKSHEFENLIALCPNCHRRADAGEIDRKSLRLYKSRLSAAIGATREQAQQTPLPTRTLSEVQTGKPGYEYQFEYPVFTDFALGPVTTELEAWGNEMLQAHRCAHTLHTPFDSEFGGPNTTSASFDIVRNDSTVLSIKYSVSVYHCGAAHGHGRTVPRSYIKHPLYRFHLQNIFEPGSNYLEFLSRYCREFLLRSDERRNEDWVTRGTRADLKNYKAFNVARSGLRITFDEYQVDCFAVGPQVVDVPYEELKPYLNLRMPRLWRPSVL